MTGTINALASGAWRRAEGLAVEIIALESVRVVVVRMPRGDFHGGKCCTVPIRWVDGAEEMLAPAKCKS